MAALSGNGLAYVAVVVRDAEAVASTLARDFALPRADCAMGNTGRTAPVFPLGQSAVALFEAGDPFVGGEDPATAVERAEAAGVQVSGLAPAEGLGGARRVFLFYIKDWEGNTIELRHY